jgi:hypothetical protein
MTDDKKDAELYQFTPAPPRPGGRPRKPRRRRLTKTAAGLAVILGAGAGGAAVASATSAGASTNTPAASATPSTSTSPGAPVPFRRFPAGPGSAPAMGPGAMLPFGALGGGFGSAGAIHGTFTVKGPNGSYETIDTQYGTAEAVSSSSITVKSADGFSQTYTVGSSTVVFAKPKGITSVKVGDTVSIQGVVSGSVVKAERVLDVTQFKAHRGAPVPVPGQGPERPDGPGGPGGPGGTGGSAA